MRARSRSHDHAHRDALHASGRRGLAAAEHAPQHRRRLPTDEPVEDAATLLRLDELHVELARVLERLADRVRRDLVEHHAPHRHLRLQHLAHVPADRLALAILVSCEDELVGALQRRLQLGDDLLLRRRARRRRRRSGRRDRCRRAGRASRPCRRELLASPCLSPAGRGCGRRSPCTVKSLAEDSPRWSSPSPVTPR